jgi:glycosyltransferase involved in cell wall biosynthesis
MKISAVIPSYNNANTIERALDSLRLQKRKPDEIIVVDDCSTDDTSAVVVQWAKKYSVDVELLHTNSNSGPAVARNLGISTASGDWIAFLDADDEWLPHRLSVQTEVLRLQQMHDTALICSRIIRNKAPLVERKLKETDVTELNLNDFAFGNPIATSSVLVLREAIQKIGGFDEQFRGPEDYDLWMRIAKKFRIIRVELELAVCYEQQNGLSMNYRLFLPQVLAVIDKAYGKGGVFEGSPWRNTARSCQILSAGWMACRSGRKTDAFRLWVRGVLASPAGLPDWKLQWKARLKLLWYILKN